MDLKIYGYIFLKNVMNKLHVQIDFFDVTAQ